MASFQPPGVIPRREGPGDRRPCQPREDVRVLVDVQIIVRADETISNHAGPDRDDREREERAED